MADAEFWEASKARQRRCPDPSNKHDDHEDFPFDPVVGFPIILHPVPGKVEHRDFQISENPDFRRFGRPGIRTSGFPDSRTSGFSEVGLLKFRETLKSELSGVPIILRIFGKSGNPKIR